MKVAAVLLVWAVGDSHKVNPVSCNILEEHYWHQIGGRGDPYYAAPSYQGQRAGKLWKASSVWDSAKRLVSLRAASNEFVSFQVIVEGSGRPVKGISVRAGDLTGPGGVIKAKDNVEVFVEWYMKVPSLAKDSWDHKTYHGPTYWYPDALIPCALEGWDKVDLPDKRLGVDGQKCQGFWVDVYVPHGTQAGTYRGKAVVSAEGAAKRVLDLQLQVLPWELPDELSFVAEMNTYSNGFARAPNFDAKHGSAEHYAIEEAFHKMAHRHRCTLNIFPGWPSRRERTPEQVVDQGYVPKIAGAGEQIRVADWSAFDKHFEKYFTGEAFKDCPRKGVPLTHFYLPLSLGWPSKFSQYYDDRQKYEAEFVRILKEFDRHIAEKGWNRTQFQYFFNGKRKYGEPWNTDEPTRKDEYDALRYYGNLLIEAIGKRADRKSNIRYRIDIGTYRTAREQLDGVVDLRCVNYEVTPPAFWGKWSNGRDACKAAGEQWWYYAQDHSRQRQTRIDWALTNTVLWGWAGWDLKTHGFCQWQCMGWVPADPFALPGGGWSYAHLFYPGKRFGHDGPMASMRLKGIRRGLQDYEHLAILTRLNKGKPAQTDAILKKYYNLTGAKAGSIRVEAEDTYKMRSEVFSAILAARARASS